MRFLEAHRTVNKFTFRCWSDLLGVVFSISILTIFKSLQNNWHSVTDKISKKRESFRGHTPSVCPNLSIQEYFSNHDWLVDLVFYGDLFHELGGSKAQRILSRWALKNINAFDSMTVWPSDRERTISLVIGPSTDLYRSFLERCTLTNFATWTIWRDLSKRLRKIQDPYPRPFGQSVFPLTFWPELSYSFAGV